MHVTWPCPKVFGIGIKTNLISPGVVQGFAESLQHCIRPQSAVTSLYGRFRAQCLPYKEVTEIWGLMWWCKDSAKPCTRPFLARRFITRFTGQWISCMPTKPTSARNMPWVYKAALGAVFGSPTAARYDTILQFDNFWKTQIFLGLNTSTFDFFVLSTQILYTRGVEVGDTRQRRFDTILSIKVLHSTSLFWQFFCTQIIYTRGVPAWPYAKMGGARRGGATCC